MRFADTNILLYALSRDDSEREKAVIANALLRERDLALSAQVLQEFYVQASRPTRPDRLPSETAAELVTTFLRLSAAILPIPIRGKIQRT